MTLDATTATIPVTSQPRRRSRSLSPDDMILRAGVVALGLLLCIGILFPLVTLLAKSFQNADGALVGLANYVRYFSTPALYASLWNSVWVAIVATVIVIPLAFVYAFALTRSRMPMRGLFAAIAQLPLFAPSLLPAIALVYVFGNQGLLKPLLMGATIYGPIGIVIAQVLYCFPHALLILITALSLADQRLYEVAESLGTTRSRVLLTVTLPGVKYGLISACFVVFTLVVTDFGIAKVIGGQFNVLATDAYKQVVGQQNFQMGAVVGMVLLVPAVVAFAIDRLAQRRQVSLLSARAVPLEPKPSAMRDGLLCLYVAVISAFIVGILGVAVWASFITYWPYNLTLSLKWYNFTDFEPNGWGPYVASLEMAAIAAAAGTTVVFTGAYVVEKTRGIHIVRGFVQFLAMLPMAVPGLVLGLAYVFFFNARWNPINSLYGTLLLLAINSIVHFYTTAHVTALTALKQLDSEFEAVSQSLKVPFYRTFARVTVPICLPAILDIAVYLFVNALTTVSSVIFLYGASNKLAAISIVHMDEAGTTAAAAAMATVIILTALCVKLLHLMFVRGILWRLQAWRRR